MLISHRKKFIFIKTFKTAGSSVEGFFEKYCYPEGEWFFSPSNDMYINNETGFVGYRGGNKSNERLYNHMPAIEIKSYLGEELWGEYFKFTIVRNPFDKLISAYFYFERNNIFLKSSDDYYIEGFRKWLKLGNKVLDKNLYTIEDEVVADYIIRYEDLTNGVRHVCNHLDILYEFDDVPNLKTKYRENSLSVNEFYDVESIDIVKKLYSFELDMFNYKL